VKAPSLTARLSLLFAGAAAVVLLAVGLVLAHAVENHFLEQDRHEIEGKLELIGRLLARTGDPAALRRLPRQLDDALVGHHGLTVAVTGADGAAWYASPGAAFPAAFLEQSAEGRPVLRLWPQDGHIYRGTAVRLPTALPGKAPASVAIALDITHHRVFMAEFRRLLAAAMALAALTTAALGWFATRRGLRPLREIAQTAASISASRLAERLHEAHVPAELQALVASFNAMLARLEEAFRRLSDFSSDLAHELRTPVSNLLTQTQVALGRARSAEEYREVLYSNMEEYERLSRMISDMLFLAKADHGLIVPRAETVDLAAEVEGLFAFYEALAEDAGVRLEAGGRAQVVGDRLMLRRALANLLSNAIRHTPRGGTVRVAIEAAGPIEARIRVENPGETIAPEHLPRLFDRFYRVDASRSRGSEGAGLGLAITRSIVEAHEGTISAGSSGGVTRFELRLPTSAPGKTSPAPP